jgi:CBS domain-containing protein
MTELTYKVIEIFTSEEARWKGSPLYEAVIRAVAREKSAARCLVSRAIGGCYENGELASHRVLDLSYNMPIKIEIILLAPELERILSRVEEIVTDGIVVVEDMEIRLHRTTGGLLPRGILVRDVMTPTPVSVMPQTGLRDLIALLVRSEFDGVPVTDGGGSLVGMVTQEDLVSKGRVRLRPDLLAGLLTGADIEKVAEDQLFVGPPAFLNAADVMTPGPATVGQDVSLAEAVKIMAAKNLKRLPVVDGEKHLVGMLARIDILRLASTSSSRRQMLTQYGATVTGATPVGGTKLMQVPTVSPDTPASEILDLLDDESQRVVVLGSDGVLLGIISDRDLLPLLDPKGKHKAREFSAGSLMRSGVPSVPESASVERALELMVDGPYKRLPVVDDDGKYVGMLGREELLRVLLPDEQG